MRLNPNYTFNMENYGDAGGEPQFLQDPPRQAPSESMAPSPFEGGNMQSLLASMGAGGPMRSMQPVPMGPDAFSSAPQAPIAGGGVAGSGMLNPEEFNLEIKDKMSKRDGEGSAPVGGLSNISGLSEGIRSALSRIGGGMSAAGPLSAPAAGAEGPASAAAPHEALRAMMRSRLGR